MASAGTARGDSAAVEASSVSTIAVDSLPVSFEPCQVWLFSSEDSENSVEQVAVFFLGARSSSSLLSRVLLHNLVKSIAFPSFSLKLRRRGVLAGSSVGSGASACEAPRGGSAVVLVAVTALGASKVCTLLKNFESHQGRLCEVSRSLVNPFSVD